MASAVDPADPATVPTRYWHTLDDGRVRCDVCPRARKLHDGRRGVCFVRGRTDGQVIMTSCGRSSGSAIDPIEKTPLDHFVPGTAVLAFGTAGSFCPADPDRSAAVAELQLPFPRPVPGDGALTVAGRAP